MIQSGQKTEDEFKFDPKSTGMKFMPVVSVSDIYLSPGNVIIRMAISEAYIIKFEAKESLVEVHQESFLLHHDTS